MKRERVLLLGPWLKTPGWRAGAWLVGIAVLLAVLDWAAGDLINLTLGRVWTAALIGGFALSAPYGIAWVKGRAPEPPKPPNLLPQATVQGDRGHTYVIVGPNTARPGLGRSVRARELGPISWAIYTVLWRWPLMTGDAILVGFWRVVTRVFGFNGGPQARGFDAAQVDEIDYSEDLPPPDRQSF